MTHDLHTYLNRADHDRTLIGSSDLPSTSEVIRILRLAATRIGMSAQVLRSLETLLCCLPPRRNHHIVFASNETLSERSGGLNERSLRRHIQRLIQLGLVERNDSPNRKRYTCRNQGEGTIMRFGLDLSPLFNRLEILRHEADRAAKEAEALRYLRCKLRALAARILMTNPDNMLAQDAQRIARRSLPQEILQDCLEQLSTVEPPQVTISETEILAVTAGQNDRHQSNISKEYIDIKPNSAVVSEVLNSEAEALAYAPHALKTAEDITSQARLLAPMIGISLDLYQRAAEARGSWAVSSLIWMIVQMGQTIRKPAAYFQALSLGRKAINYQPWAWLAKTRVSLSADNVA